MAEYLILDRYDEIIDEVTIEGGYQDMVKEVARRISDRELPLLDLCGSKVYVRCGGDFTRDIVREFEKREILDEMGDSFDESDAKTTVLEIGGKIVTVTIEERS